MDKLMSDLGDVRDEEAVTLDNEACSILLDWWEPKRRGRPDPIPMIDYVEAEEVRSKIIAKMGKEYGIGKRVNHAMAKRWNTTEDAARKRIDAARKMFGKLKD
jgi:hypothetical protein